MDCIKVWNQQRIRINPDNRYVCLNDMAGATGKKVHDWIRLKNTEEYFNKLSELSGIPVTSHSIGFGSLICSTYGGNQEQGTWAHPKVALRFAQWCSVDFAIQIDFWIDELLTSGSVNLDSYTADRSSQDALLAKDIVALAAQAIEESFKGLGLKPELIAGLKLNMAEQVTPELKPYLLEARSLIINQTAQGNLLLTATEIGKRLNISAQAVNKKLQELGLQAKNANKKSKKDCAYVPCGQGHEFSDLTLATGLGKDQTTYQQLRWYESILTLLS